MRLPRANSHLVKHRRGLAAVACLVAAGCTPEGRDRSLEGSIQPQARLQALADGSQIDGARNGAARARRGDAPQRSVPPLAALPGETVAAVRTRDYVDGVRQDITLKGTAVRGISNGITVLVRTTRQPTLDESVPLYKPAEAGIRSEIGAQFSHVPMQVVERSSSNGYGPYGLALGRAAGNARCLYMWQWIDANRLPSRADYTGPASVRVRLCRADATFDEMAAEMDHLTLGDSAVAPAVATPIAAAPVAVADQVIVAPPEAGPPEAGPPGAVLPEASEPEPPARAAAKAHRGRRRLAKRRPPKPSKMAVQEDMPAGRPAEQPADVPAGGPRYMSPSVSARPDAPQPAPSPPAQLPSDLPAQAYLGPKASSQPLAPN